MMKICPIQTIVGGVRIAAGLELRLALGIEQ
jgi:hypothetical protein